MIDHMSSDIRPGVAELVLDPISSLQYLLYNNLFLGPGSNRSARDALHVMIG
jgi:hypothetical protein